MSIYEISTPVLEEQINDNHAVNDGAWASVK
jgi:hypothetical protein